MKNTKTKTKATVLRTTEIAHLQLKTDGCSRVERERVSSAARDRMASCLVLVASVDPESVTDAERDELEARGLATIEACNRLIKTARKMEAKNANRPEHPDWAKLRSYQAAKYGEPVPVYSGTSAHYVLQGLDFRGEARRADTETDRAKCEKLASESFDSAIFPRLPHLPKYMK